MTCHSRAAGFLDPAVAPVAPARRQRGAIACRSGQMAEDQVAARYAAAGWRILARRWRAAGAEIDLIAARGDCTVFIEVKRAATHEAAAQRLDRWQMDRICRAAATFAADLPAGLDSEMRFDLALVDGFGRIDVIENAFGES